MRGVRKRLDRLGLPLIVGLVVGSAACTEGADPDTAGPSGSASPAAALVGGLIVGSESGLYVLRQEPGQPRLKATELKLPGGQRINNQVVSPDRRTLAYLTERGIVLRDLATGADREITPTVGGAPMANLHGCLHWSPDSRLLSLQTFDDTLYLGDTTGRFTMVDAVKRVQYRQQQFIEPQDGPIIPGRSEIDCGRWAGNDRFVFDRVRVMPESVSTSRGATEHVVKPDTSTMAVLSGGTVRLVDSATRWTVVDQCGTKLVTRKPIGGDEDLYLVDGLTEQALATADAATPATGHLPYTGGPGGDLIRFFSDTCQLMRAARSKNMEGKYFLRYLDPVTRQATREIPLTHPASSASPLAWSPRQGDHTLAGLAPGAIHLTNYDTGTTTTVPTETVGISKSDDQSIVAWIP